MKISKVISVKAILLLLLLSSTTFAATIISDQEGGVTTISPSRDAEQFSTNQAPLSYVSFNNFQYAIPGDPTDERNNGSHLIPGRYRNYDEREFLLARKCAGRTCEGYGFKNTLDLSDLEPEDRVEFEVYFHNNGPDPYDNTGDGVTAHNVKIGIDINDISNPVGFIYADDNSYRQPPDSNNASLRYQTGDYILENGQQVGDLARTASDDVTFNSIPENVELELMPDFAYLYIAYGKKSAEEEQSDPDAEPTDNLHTFVYDNIGNAEENVTIDTPADADPNQSGKNPLLIKVNKVTTDGKKIYLHFDQLPGCLRYSGYIYFRLKAKEVSPPVCTDLSWSNPQEIILDNVRPTQLNGQRGYVFQGNYITFNNAESLPESYIDNPTVRYTTTDSEGKFYKIDIDTSDILHVAFRATLLNPTTNYAVVPLQQGLVYIGEETVTLQPEYETAESALTEGQANPEVCHQEYTVLKISNACTGLAANVDEENPVTINEKDAYKITTSVEFSDHRIPVGAKLHFLSINDQEGKFYNSDFEDITQRRSDGAGVPYTLVDPGTVVYYSGKGSVVINLQGIPTSQANPEVCFAELPIPQEEAPICKELKVNHPETIRVNELSSFSSVAYDTEGNLFEDTITYWVDNEEGTFYTAANKPEGYIENTDNVWEFGLIYPVPGNVTEINPDVALNVVENLLTKNNFSTFQGLDFSYMFQDNVFNLGDFGSPSDIETNAPEVDARDFIRGRSGLTLQDEVIEALDAQGNSITVNRGETVYFLAQKPGTVKVRATTTPVNGDCYREFPIIGVKPPLCQSLQVDKPEKFISGTVSEVRAQSVGTDGNAFGEKITYNIDPGFGCIYTTKPNNYPENPYPTVNSGATNQLMPAKTLNKLYTLDNVQNLTYSLLTKKTSAQSSGTKVKDFGKNDILDVSSKILKDSAKSPLTVDEVTSGKTKTDRLFPAQLDIRKYSNFGLKAKAKDLPTIGNILCPISATVDPGQSVWVFTTEASDGINVVHVDTQNTTNPNCSADYPVEAQQLVCTDLAVLSNGAALTDLAPGEVYRLTSTATYSTEAEFPMSVYTSDEGIFVPIEQSGSPLLDLPIQQIQETLLETYLAAGRLNRDSWQETSRATGIRMLQQITVDDGSPILFVTFPDAAGEDALTVQAAFRDEEACIKKFNVIAPPEKLPCQNIEVVYGSGGEFPGAFDPTKDTLISVREGNFGDYEGGFEFRAETASGTLATGRFSASRVGDGETPNTPANPRTFTQEESSAGIFYRGGAEGDKIVIHAVGDAQSTVNCAYVISSVAGEVKCTDLSITEPSGTWTENDFTGDDEQRFEIDVETEPANYVNNLEFKWVVTEGSADFRNDQTDSSDSNPLVNFLEDIVSTDDLRVRIFATDENGNVFRDASGNQLCVATKELNTEEEEKTPPEITKAVYSVNDENWDDLSNISENDDFVTYKVEYETNDYASTEMWEANMDRGEITSIEPEELDGVLVFDSMVIGIDDGNDQKIVYRSEDFEESRYDNEEIDGTEITDFDDWDEFEDEDDAEDFFNDNYSCDENENDFCVETDFDNIEEYFKEGTKADALQFRNTDQIEKIYIIYQFANETDINAEKCKNLDADDGCGEEFVNEIDFEASENDDFTGDTETGDDSTTVVVICPFVLSRQGGDVVFHSAVDTGRSVRFCFEQLRDVEGVNVQPIPRPIQRLFKSGGEEGATQEQVLSTPSHDICKYDGGQEINDELKNAFENFSSSVCEMKAALAQEWTQTYIRKAIEANVDKITRWGTQEGNISIADMAEVDSKFPNNTTSGVYVVEGNLTVKNTSGPFEIEKTDSVPAAQTYIVKNGTLRIESNIQYNDNSVNPSDPSSFPSAAFVVINGDIEISNSVDRIDGILMAVNTEANDKGQIKSLENTVTTSTKLLVNGSMIGNVNNIFTNRKAVGNPLKDEGSITVRYDERILLNTPPGLSELIDVAQFRVAN